MALFAALQLLPPLRSFQLHAVVTFAATADTFAVIADTDTTAISTASGAAVANGKSSLILWLFDSLPLVLFRTKFVAIN